MIQRKKLGEIANISAGQGAPQGAENYSEEGTPFVKAGDLFYLVNGERECDIQKVSEEVAKNHRLKLYPKGTVLFAKSGMSCMKGYVYATNAECYVVSHLACIMPFDVDSKYLKYYFEYHKPNQLVKDASYPSISLADIAEMPINVFDDQTEAKIVDNLDAVNSLIAKSKEELGLLDNIVKSRFVEMFGEPVSNTFGWEQLLLCNVTSKIGSGATPKGGKESYQAEGITLIRSMNVHDGRFEYKDLAHITDEQATQLNNVIVQENDVFINITGASVARSCIVPSSVLPARVNQHVAIIRCVPERLNAVFANNMFLNDRFKGQLLDIGESGGATRQAITKQQLENLTVIVPPLELQNRFAAFVAEVDKSKLAVQQSIDQLETLKKSLMQKYFG